MVANECWRTHVPFVTVFGTRHGALDDPSPIMKRAKCQFCPKQKLWFKSQDPKSFTQGLCLLFGTGQSNGNVGLNPRTGRRLLSVEGLEMLKVLQEGRLLSMETLEVLRSAKIRTFRHFHATTQLGKGRFAQVPLLSRSPCKRHEGEDAILSSLPWFFPFHFKLKDKY